MCTLVYTREESGLCKLRQKRTFVCVCVCVHACVSIKICESYKLTGQRSGAIKGIIIYWQVQAISQIDRLPLVCSDSEQRLRRQSS